MKIGPTTVPDVRELTNKAQGLCSRQMETHMVWIWDFLGWGLA